MITAAFAMNRLAMRFMAQWLMINLFAMNALKVSKKH
jgi:hypothetical protein